MDYYVINMVLIWYKYRNNPVLILPNPWKVWKYLTFHETRPMQFQLNLSTIYNTDRVNSLSLFVISLILLIFS